MKKSSLMLAIMIASVSAFSQLQWVKGGNNFFPLGLPPTVGTSALWNSPLKVITFGVQRMHIDNGNGFVAIGTNFSTPVNLLHLNGFGNNTGQMFRTDGNRNFDNMWQLFTGTNAGNTTEKGRVFTSLNMNTQTAGSVTGLASVANNSFNHLGIFAPLGDVVISATGVNPLLGTAVSERMRITGFDVPLPNMPFPSMPVTRVAISENNPITIPLSLLHIGHPWGSFTTGPHRDWMDIGTYYHQESDGMYVGMKHLGSDRNEGIITFGNNPANNPLIGDRMRFLFVGAAGNGTSSTNQGLEFMHMVTFDGTNPRISVGDFLTQGVNADPRNTLEILSSPTSPYFSSGNGSSGLKFRNLTSNNIPVANPGPGVLALDTGGNVIYVPAPIGGGGGTVVGAHNGTSISTITPSFVSFGNDFNATLGQLLSNREVPMNNFSILFSDPTPFGVPGANLPLSPNTFSFGRLNTVQTVANPKMYTHTDAERVSGMFVTDASAGSSAGFSNTHLVNPVSSFAFNSVGPTGVTGYSFGGNGFRQKSGVVGIGDGSAATTGSPLSQYVYGVYGQALGTTAVNITAVGVRGSSPYTNGSSNIGGSFDAQGAAANTGVAALASASGNLNIGLSAQATGAPINYGVYATSTSTGVTDNYGVFGWAQGAPITMRFTEPQFQTQITRDILTEMY